ncbi:MAG: DUF6932 family protein [Candidatus Electronema sp. V4]|uniref:DUF6932 family protein n=1 Tax=Candidatus Electronema sp. V4 TaxID=3454756 RepID=UPI004055378D
MDYEPLYPAGFVDIRDTELEATFLEPFGDKSRRKYLLGRFSALIERFKETGLNAEVWIDGSFATKKPEPVDIDTIFFLDSDKVSMLCADKQNILNELKDRKYSKIRYDCDFFISLNGDANWRSYWRGWFGFSRYEEPKGIIRLYI